MGGSNSTALQTLAFEIVGVLLTAAGLVLLALQLRRKCFVKRQRERSGDGQSEVITREVEAQVHHALEMAELGGRQGP